MSSPAQTLPASRAATQGSWWSEVSAVLVKDVRSELRTRAALATILLFALVVLLIVALTVITEGFGLTRELLPADEMRQILQQPGAKAIDVTRATTGTSVTRASILSGLYWVILFFSAMAGLPRAFVKEEEMRTAPVLRLTARPSAVFAGKLLFNAALSLVVTAVLLLPFLFLFRPIVADWPSFLLHLPLGAVGMAGAATILGAMVARAGGKTYLMLPLSFPILLPVLTFAINGTAAAISGNEGNQLLPLVSYVVLMVTVSSFLFEMVWSE